MRILTENIKCTFTSFTKKVVERLVIFGGGVCQIMQIYLIVTANVRILCLSYNVKNSDSRKKITETNRDQIEFHGFLYQASAYKIPFLFVVLHESGTGGKKHQVHDLITFKF